eukprot:12426843-Karenia_brevis.AAC.1
MLTSPHSKAAYSYIAHDFSPPLHALRADNGKFVTSPDAMDQLLREKWAPIYAGNVGSVAQLVTNYVCKYAHFLFIAPEAEVPDLTGRDLQQVAIDSASSASGLDLWTYDDLRLMPIIVFDFLVEILKCVEDGAPWPQQLLHQKAHLLSKDLLKRLDPLQY